MSHKKAQKAQRKLATDFTDSFGHKKAQKTSKNRPVDPRQKSK
jgi:hypothetical protein